MNRTSPSLRTAIIATVVPTTRLPALAQSRLAVPQPKDIKAHCMDFNWGPGGPNGSAKPGLWADADPAKHVAWYRAMGANVIQTFCVSCNGYTWYTNGVVPKQPGLKHDFLREVATGAHIKGILVLKACGIVLFTLLTTAVALSQTIVSPPDAPANVKLAAKEIRRYVYLRTGELLPIAESGEGIVLKVDPTLAPQSYHLKPDGATLTISGGSDVGLLYGAYRYSELLGVRFQIDGDVIPDERLTTSPAIAEESGQPLFELRGLQPFHDFPEGPDWWTQDDWLSVVSQATKMRMNFIGLHTYPFHNRDLGPEPTVWVGLPEDVNADGTVKVADYSSWYTTAKFMPYGCYAPSKTGNYSFGGAEVFPSDDYGPEVNAPDDFPMPKTPAASVAMINRTGLMLKTVFDEAHRRGMKIAVGTESPLDIPDVVVARLTESGMRPDDPATLQKLYAGMFTRIQRAYPIDHYWIWGHEGEIDQRRFIANIQAAHAALQETQAPFRLGICGWGWITGNFPSLDQALPKDVFFSAISMSTGHAPVSETFAHLDGRQKWAIPWFEDDGALTSIQPAMSLRPPPGSTAPAQSRSTSNRGRPSRRGSASWTNSPRCVRWFAGPAISNASTGGSTPSGSRCSWASLAANAASWTGS